MNKLKIMFLCTGNSCRSQMAEGWAHALKSDVIDAYSAGVDPHGMNPRAIHVMAEAGVDISRHTSRHVDALAHIPFDCVITVCDHAHETCPLFPGTTKVIHVGFDDPPRLARTTKIRRRSPQPLPPRPRRIKAFIQTLPEALPQRGLANSQG